MKQANTEIQSNEVATHYSKYIKIFKNCININGVFEEGEDGKPQEIELICKYMYEESQVILNKTTLQLIETDEGMFIIGIDHNALILNGEINFFDIEDELEKSGIFLQSLRLLNNEANRKLVVCNEIETIITRIKLKQNFVLKTIDNIKFSLQTKTNYQETLKLIENGVKLINRIIFQIENAINYYKELYDEEKEIFKKYLKNVKEILFFYSNIRLKLNKHKEIIDNLLAVHNSK